MSRRKIRLTSKSRHARIAANKRARVEEKKTLIQRLFDYRANNRARKGLCIDCGIPLTEDEQKASKVCALCHKKYEKKKR